MVCHRRGHKDHQARSTDRSSRPSGVTSTSEQLVGAEDAHQLVGGIRDLRSSSFPVGDGPDVDLVSSCLHAID